MDLIISGFYLFIYLFSNTDIAISFVVIYGEIPYAHIIPILLHVNTCFLSKRKVRHVVCVSVVISLFSAYKTRI